MKRTLASEERRPPSMLAGAELESVSASLQWWEWVASSAIPALTSTVLRLSALAENLS